MSSRELSKLADKRHDNTLKLISTLIDGGVLKNTTLSNWTNPQNNQQYPEFLSDKRDSLVIIARLSPEFTAALVDRWQELELRNNLSIPDFNNPVAAARAWADAKESELKAIHYVEIAKPAVEFVERYVQSTGNLGFRQVCKLLKANETQFRAFLSEQKIMYKLGGDWVPYGCHIVLGRFHTSTGTSDNDHNYTAAKFTPKGIQWISELWLKHHA